METFMICLLVIFSVLALIQIAQSYTLITHWEKAHERAEIQLELQKEIYGIKVKEEDLGRREVNLNASYDEIFEYQERLDTREKELREREEFVKERIASCEGALLMTDASPKKKKTAKKKKSA